MQIEVGTVLDGKVTKIAAFGAFVSLPEGKSGMVHISEISAGFVRDIRDFVKEEQEIRVKVIGIDDRGRISLSIRQAQPEEPKIRNIPLDPKPKRSADSFEDMMNRFLSQSSDKMSDLKQRGEQPKRRRREP